MKWLVTCLLLASFQVRASGEEVFDRQLRFYLQKLLKAQGASQKLGISRCHTDALELRYDAPKLLLQTATRSFHERSFESSLTCQVDGGQFQLVGRLLLETLDGTTRLKDVTFSHNRTRHDFENLLSEYGYFSLQDILKSKP